MKWGEKYKGLYEIDDRLLKWAAVPDTSIVMSGMYNAVVTIRDTDTLIGVIVSLYKMGYKMDNVSIWNMVDICKHNKTVFLVNGHVSVGMICDSRFDSDSLIMKQQKEWVENVATTDDYYSRKPFVDCGMDNIFFEIVAQCQRGVNKSIPYKFRYNDGRERLTYLPENYNDLSDDTKKKFEEVSMDYIKEHLDDAEEDGISFRDRLL